MTEKDARLAFAKALEHVHGKRYLAVRKTKSAIARAIGQKVKKFYCTFRVDTGYCVLSAFRDPEGMKQVEEYRIIGTSITADVMMDWSEDLDITDPQFHACLMVKGSDLRKEDGKQLSGEIYIFGKDSGEILQIKQAVLALSKAARSPDGSCIYGRFTPDNVSLRTGDAGRFKLDHDQAVQITRACTRIVALPTVIPQMFGEQASRQDARAALQLLSVPPSLGDGDEADARTVALSGRALLEVLNRLPAKPIPSTVFSAFSGQAEKCRLRFESEHDGVSPGAFIESEAFSFVCSNMLRDLGSVEAIQVLKEVTRAVKHVVQDFRGTVSMMECVDALGPLLLDDYKKPNSRELGWFMACVCSKYRDKIFSKSISGEISRLGSSPGPVSILKIGRSTGNWGASTNENEKSVVLRTSSVHSFEAASQPGTPQTPATFSASSTIQPSPIPARTPMAFTATPPQQGVKKSSNLNGNSAVSSPPSSITSESPKGANATSAEADLKRKGSFKPITETPNDAKSTNMDNSESAVQQNSPTMVAMSVHPSDFVNIQEEIDALTRLFEYYRERLRDDPSHPNAYLWKREMAEVESEIAALGPTMFFVSSKAGEGAEQNVDQGTTSHVHERNGETDDRNTETAPLTERNEADRAADPSEFIDRALSLWAESRKEALAGPADQLSDSFIVLNSALQDVRNLAQNVDEFPGMAKSSKPTRQAALALVGMLEENVSLRLRLLGKDENGASSSQFNHHPINQIKSSGAASTSGKAASSPRLGADGMAVSVQEEEYEI